MAFAREVARGNEEAWEVVDEQSARIASLEAEVARLRAELAEREPVEPEPAVEGSPAEHSPAEHEATESKPKASRRKTSEQTGEAILADLAAGLSQKEATARNAVSVMTVLRVARGV